jgi:hypothetical protein
MEKELRYAEIVVNPKWKKSEFKDLKKGNIFRLYNPDGELCLDIAIATSDAYLNKEDDWTVDYNVAGKVKEE